MPFLIPELCHHLNILYVIKSILNVFGFVLFCFRVVYLQQQQQPQSNKCQLVFHRHKMEQEDKQKRESAVVLLTLGEKRVLPYLVEFLLAIAHQVLTKENCLEMEEHTHTVIIIMMKNINV